MKYIVMECHPGYAVLLDEEGRFVKAANFHYQTGDTVEDPVLMKRPAPGKKRRFRAVMGMAAAAACFLLMFGGYYQNYMRAETAVYLTINPSVCMELNQKGSVVRLTGANEDGEALLENYKRSSSDRLVVMDELIDRAIDMGFLSAGGTVTIDIDAPDTVKFQQYGSEFRVNLTEYLESKLLVEIQIFDHDRINSGGSDTEPDMTAVTEGEQPDMEPKASDTEGQKSGEDREMTEKESSSGPAAAPEKTQTKSQPEEPANAGSPASKPVPETIDPGTDYGSSDYGSSDYSTEPENSGYGTDYQEREEDSGHGSSDYGSSDYDSSDYGSSDYDSSDYDSSDYE